VPNLTVEFDAEALAAELFQEFECFLLHECNAEVHRALAVAPAAVFGTYFDRKPPFDGESSKEFPDAFVVEALRQWCRKKGDRMLVVTEDKAMTRAVSGDRHLLALKNINEVLSRAAADLGVDGEAAADAVLSKPAFESSLEAVLRAQMKELVYLYSGELADGKAYEGELLSIEEVSDWSVVGLSDRRVTMTIDGLERRLPQRRLMTRYRDFGGCRTSERGRARGERPKRGGEHLRPIRRGSLSTRVPLAAAPLHWK
jgi:PIN domain